MAFRFQIKKNSDQAGVEEKFVHSLLSYEISEFTFLYIAIFKMLGSCPIQTKLIVSVPHGM